jgi:hypothetical protein
VGYSPVFGMMSVEPTLAVLSGSNYPPGRMLIGMAAYLGVAVLREYVVEIHSLILEHRRS